MDKVFFYGMLQDIPLLETVLGHGLDTQSVSSAFMQGHALFSDNALFIPHPVKNAGSQIKGVVVAGLAPGDILRLDFFMGGFGMALRRAEVLPEAHAKGPSVRVVTYFPDELPRPSGKAWTLKEWQLNWRELALQAAKEAMMYYTRITARELSRRMPFIYNRAAASLRAKHDTRTPTRGREMLRSDVEILSHTIPYSNFFTMQEFDLKYRRFDGKISGQVARAAFTGFDAVIVLPYDPVSDRVLLVEQLRFGSFARGAIHPWSLEPVAGHIDLGETPEQSAFRETREEAAIELTELIPISRSYPSPGCSTEYYYIFAGLCELGNKRDGLAGLPSENEDIRYHVLSFDQLMALVDSFEAENGPLVLAALWLARNRDRLRDGRSEGA